MAQGALLLEDLELGHDAGRLWIYVSRLSLLPLDRLASEAEDTTTRLAARVLIKALRIVDRLVEHSIEEKIAGPR